MKEKMRVDIKNTHKSKSTMFFGNLMLWINDIVPTIESMLNMLLPTMLAITMLPCLRTDATMAVTNSGKHVPIATIPSPITSLLILKFCASVIAPFKNKDEPKMSKNIPTKANNIAMGRLKLPVTPRSELIFLMSRLENAFLSCKYE